jgi:integrase
VSPPSKPYQRSSDGRWLQAIEVGWNANGTRRRVTVTGKTEAEVKRKYRDRKAVIDAAAGRVSSGAVLRRTVKSWADEWLAIRQTTKRPATFNVDRSAMKWILPALGARRLVELAPRDVRAFQGAMRSAGLPPSTMNRYQRTLAKMLRDAQQEGIPVAEAVVDAPGVPQSENDRQAMETVQAVAVMHHAADLPHGARYFVAFYQGLRQGEALGLTWDAIDFGANTITVSWQLQPLPYLDKHDRSAGFRVPDGYVVLHLAGRFHLVRPKTRKGDRVIPMVPEIRDLLLTLRETAAETVGGLVWVRANGWPIDAADDLAEFHALQLAAGVRHPGGRPYTVHEMRNTTAQLLLEAGVDPVTITAILGHSSWATSTGYMVGRAGPMRAAMEQIAAALRPETRHELEHRQAEDG